MNLPNILSFFRILLVPLIPVFMLNSNIPGNNYIVTAILFVSGVTDVLDGYFARKNKQVTVLGKILDPLADKLTQFVVFITIYICYRHIPILMVYVIIYFAKELLMFIGTLTVKKKTTSLVSSNIVGKVATLSFYLSIGLFLLIEKIIGENELVIIILLSIPMVTTVFAFFAYSYKYIFIDKIFKKEIETSEKE